MIFRFLNLQGVAGLAASLVLVGLLLVQKGETRHWRKQSGQFEQLYRGEQAAFVATVEGYRAAADKARAADRAAAERVRAEQDAINERTNHDLETRLAAARARADGLQLEARAATADPGGGGAAPMPGLSVAAGRPAEAARQDRLPAGDALLATEQAIQLDELIGWVREQAGVDPNAPHAPR
ncbi:MAG TPA: hypothetical protein VJM15_07975 [Sphingomicrobium sp.]|nr:hypothetical protein [Sphingomicrobium sp.]